MEEPPRVRVVRGAPTPEELAALIAALRMRARAESTPATSGWVRSGRPALPLTRGRAGWHGRS